MEDNISCPVCQSIELKFGCCGDSHTTCRSCGFVFDSGVLMPCPISRPLEVTAEIPLPDHPLLPTDFQYVMDDGEDENNKLWGD